MTAAGTDVASRPYDLSGMRILLTGASGGIGQATARLCASLGAELVLTDRTPAPVLLEALAGNGRNHRFLACDVRSRSAVDDLCAAIGPVDAAILNAGVYPLSQWEEDRWDEDFDLAMQVNVRGPAHFARALLPGMKARGRGRIVVIGSIAAHTGGTYAHSPVHYACSKGAVHTFVRWLARRAAPEVLVNGVAIDEELRPWKPEYIAGAIQQDDCYVEMTFLKALEDHGLDITYEQAGRAFANTEYPLWHANYYGRENVRAGIMPARTFSRP